MEEKRKSLVRIVKFKNEDAQKLAELFNSFDREGLWPGGFTKGIPFTAERVLNTFPAGVRNICVLVSACDGMFTGVCSLHPHSEDSEAAYIGVFGVHPDYLGKGHGKALILKAIEITAENGLKRADLNTWAGNMRAVPLYKKSGMFWVPETSVYMQDYVPRIISFPLAKEFFKKHDWYSSQVRKLELTPDEFELEGMKVYPYEFAGGKDHLRVWVDRYGRGILGIEKVFEGKRLKALCRLSDPDVVAGVENELVLEIANDTGTAMRGSAFLSGFESLDFVSPSQESFNVENNKSIKLTAKFVVRPETEVPDILRKQRTIKVNLTLNGELVPLEVGLRIRPLIEFESFPDSRLTLMPGTSGNLQINVFNNAKEHFKGDILVIDENSRLSVGETSIPVSISPKSYSGFNVNMKTSEDQPTEAIPLQLFARGEIRGHDVRTKTETIYVKCLRPGGIVTSTERRDSETVLVVENDELVARVQLRGALLEITYKGCARNRQTVVLNGAFGVGPPFGFTRLVDYEYEFLRRPEDIELVLSASHPNKPGIKMMRILTFYPGVSLIKEQIRIVNMNPDVTYEINVRITEQTSAGNMFKMIVPLKNTLEQDMIMFPASESDLPTEPKDYRESWVCFQSQAQGFSFGQIWSNEKLSKVRFGEQIVFAPEYALGQLKPGQNVCTSELYYLIDKGNWQAIRKKWQMLIEKKTHFEEGPAESKPLFDIHLVETNFEYMAKLNTRLEVVNSRGKEVAGKIVLVPPEGWRIVPSELAVTKVVGGSPFSANLTLHTPSKAKPGVHSGSIEFQSDRQVTEFPLNVCLLSTTPKQRVSAAHTKEKGKRVVTVSNGLIKFKVSAEFAGCLYFLSKEDEVNQLCSNFPKIGTRVFLQNYSGGIRELYLGKSLDFEKSKSHKEQYETEIVKDGRWKGVKFNFESEEQEEMKGLHGSISYLTLSSSNVVKIKREFNNHTSARFEFNSSLWISPNVGGNFEKSELIFPRNGKTLRFRRAPGVVISGIQPEKGWAFIANTGQKAGMGLVAGNPDKSMLISIDIGKSLMELLIYSMIQLQPSESCNLEDYIVLTDENAGPMDKLSNLLRKSA